MRLSEYTGYLFRFGLLYTLREIYYRFLSNFLEKLVSGRRDKDAYRSLKRYLNYKTDFSVFLNGSVDGLPSAGNTKPVIWTCWFQGYEKAPVLVKACIESMRKNSGGLEVVIITEENLDNFIRLPGHIIKKYKSGVIPAAHFSDILRTALLLKHGGIWMDATVFLTGPIPEAILDSGFFVFQNSAFQKSLLLCSSWFISSKKGNPVLLRIFNILSSYWEKNDYLIYYFLFHIAITLTVTCFPDAGRIWGKMPYKNNSEPHILQKKLFDEVDLPVKDYIWNLSFAHKLTYKFDDELLKKENTYYKYIIGELK